ncbi:MAG: hypothetical protein IJ074_03325, partial [Clostridia bacterium]|nr:hypothetical protein [Clostridia bacterium]
GFAVSLTLYEDGRYLFDMGAVAEEAQQGVWIIHGDQILLDGDPNSALLFSGDSLVMSDEELFVTFTRDPVQSYTPAEAHWNAELTDYQGAWGAKFVSVSGVILSADIAQIDMRLTIENTSVTCTSQVLGLNGETLECAFIEGALILEGGEEADAFGVALQRLADGMLSMSVSSGDDAITLYLSAEPNG